MADVSLPDNAQEMRAQSIFAEIRCMVCEGQTIADSNAEVAKDMRSNIRQRIVSGISNADIKADMVSRYGDKILMNPPFKSGTMLLWLGPWLILSIGVFVAFFYFRSTKPQKKL